MTRQELRDELKKKSKEELLLMLEAVDGYIPPKATKGNLIDELVYEMIGREARKAVFEADYRPSMERLF